MSSMTLTEGKVFLAGGTLLPKYHNAVAGWADRAYARLREEIRDLGVGAGRS